MGTLASQAEIGVRVQALAEGFCRGPGYHTPPPKKILQYSAFWPDKMVRIAVHNVF